MPCDYKKYAPDWKQIRARILERAGHKCEQCGKPNYSLWFRNEAGDYREVAGFDVSDDDTPHILFYAAKDFTPGDVLDDYRIVKIVLTISHTNHDVTDNRDENLRALCQRCHNIHDIDYRKANRAATRRRKNPQTLCLQFD